MFERDFLPDQGGGRSGITLEQGSRIGVIGGGPAGSLFSYFTLRLAERAGLDLHVDIYERKDFTKRGAGGCNHCGGIVSESLVQLLATEGVNLPTTVVQRGIESYVLHMDVGTVAIETPSQERRIAAMYRGAGPRGETETDWRSFDSYMLELARAKGAQVRHEFVESVSFASGLPELTTKAGTVERYDLVVGAMGVNTPSTDLFEGSGIRYHAPGVTKTFICEYPLGEEQVRRYFGNAMHVFLLDLPRLKFAALIPKGSHVTMCLLGEAIDKDLVNAFQTAPAVQACFPPGCDSTAGIPCRCFPKINIRSAEQPFADRVLLLGDAGVTRLYKDGIGAAYRAAKAAATAAVLHGISEEAFRDHYWPACREIQKDNRLGKAIFLFTRMVQKRGFAKRGILRMVRGEQREAGRAKRMSGVLWDTFTGSAPYRDILRRTLKPGFLARLLLETCVATVTRSPDHESGGDHAEVGTRQALQ